jgi:predicted permease
VAEPERLVNLYISSPEYPFNVFTYPELETVRRGTAEVFTQVAGSRYNFAPRDGIDQPEMLPAELVSGHYFTVLGVRPALGRLFDSTDASAPGRSPVAVLGYRYWTRAFQSDPGAVGQTIRIAGLPYTIIGVAPADYLGTNRGIAPDIFLPLTMLNLIERNATDQLENYVNHGIFTRARLQPGVSVARATAELERIAADFRARRIPGWESTTSFRIIPTADIIVYPPIDRLLVPAAWMLMVIVGLVLVIACANLAGFLLARAVDRRKEIAVRLALGAGRGQLIAQLLVETVLVALLGGVVGVWLGRSLLAGVLALDLPLPIPITLELALDWRVVTYSVAVSVLAGVLVGLAPALQSTRLDLASIIRAENTGGGRSKGRVRSILLGGQVAVTVILLVAAGLFARSFDEIRKVDAGFGRAPAALVWAAFRPQGDPQVALDRLERRLRELPDVTSVGLTSNMHLNLINSTSMEFLVDGIEPPPGRTFHSSEQAAVDSSFFDAAGIRLVAGRNFAPFERDSTPRVAIVNERFAEMYFPGREAVGQRFRTVEGESIEIVGVAATARIRTLAETPQPFIYQSSAQLPPTEPWLVIRTDGNAEQVLNAALRTIRETEPDVFVLQSRTMARHLEVMSLPLKLAAIALMAFAGLALIIASVGLYGMVSYAVAQRSREVGIRLSLGADRGSVIRLLLVEGLRMVGIGAGIGLLLALVLARLLQGLLVGVHAADPVTFIAVPLVILTVAAVAAYVPARRAGEVDPVVALKAE